MEVLDRVAELEEFQQRFHSGRGLRGNASVRGVLNGILVDEGSGSSLNEGRILFQSEGSEMVFRRIVPQPSP